MKRKNSNVKFLSITSEHDNQRIDNFLRTQLKGVPKSMIYRILRKGFVRVNTKKTIPKYKLIEGDIIKLPPIRVGENKDLPSSNLSKISSLNNDILYEDEYMIVLNKRAGIAVHGGSGLSFGVIEALRALRSKSNYLGLVHRLDKNTSGILLIAKKHSVLRIMNEQLYNKKITKNYLALARGTWPSNLHVIKMPLQKTILKSGQHIMRVHNKGKPSETHFKVVERFGFATLVQVVPITGRTHQIRVHMSQGGYPIAFDDRYGNNTFDCQLKFTGLSRLFLHASRITFTHPFTHTKLQIEAPIDNILQHCIHQLRLKRDAMNL